MTWGDVTFSDILKALEQHDRYTKGLEERIKRLEHERDGWRDAADPGWRDRERQAALDGEIRLMREQG